MSHVLLNRSEYFIQEFVIMLDVLLNRVNIYKSLPSYGMFCKTEQIFTRVFHHVQCSVKQSEYL